jgi:hypothetical protein
MYSAAMCAVALGVALVTGPALASSTNTITISVPAHVVAGTKSAQTYAVSVHGFARGGANAYLFIDYLGCAKSFATEYHRAGKDARSRWTVSGAFRGISYWNSDYAGIDHACGYLIGQRSGKLLATAKVSFRIHSH